ncbi:MBL fold metallo-hydrolase [Candidatus Woesearchaeota archaeon]|nr:MBL fold metallo-hydrolase [Candidatus Woesearchaeota archaeon]
METGAGKDQEKPGKSQSGPAACEIREMMKITVLGCGTYMPEIDKATSSYLARPGPQNLVFDIGRGSINNLLKAGLGVKDIDALFITHMHPDHCNDLLSLLHHTLNLGRRKTLMIYGPPGTRKAIEAVRKILKIGPKQHIALKDLRDRDKVEAKGWLVSCFAVKHSTKMKSLAYRLESGGKVFAYTGDCEDCKKMREAIKDADLAIIEANFAGARAGKGHLTAEQAAKAADESGVKRLVLTHIDPHHRKTLDKRKVKALFAGTTEMAEDLKEFRI